MLSWYQEGVVTHAAVNACLAPLCSVDGMAVTTVEGIGSSRGLLHPVQVHIHCYCKNQINYITSTCILPTTIIISLHVPLSPLPPMQERIARAHGSQCGFCTPGFVMSMYTLLRNSHAPSEKQIEGAFEGTYVYKVTSVYL